MNLEDAIRIAIREYYTGNAPVRFMEEYPDMKYTPEYFSKLEAEIEEEMSGKDKGERLDDDLVEEEEMQDDD